MNPTLPDKLEPSKWPTIHLRSKYKGDRTSNFTESIWAMYQVFHCTAPTINEESLTHFCEIGNTQGKTSAFIEHISTQERH